MHRHLLVLASITLFVPSPPLAADPQTGQTSSSENIENHSAQNDPELTILRVTTREVLIDLIALDRHNQPVLDLKPDEIQVSESAEAKGKQKAKKRAHRSTASASVASITSLSIVDPNGAPLQTRREPDFGLWRVVLSAPPHTICSHSIRDQTAGIAVITGSQLQQIAPGSSFPIATNTMLGLRRPLRPSCPGQRKDRSTSATVSLLLPRDPSLDHASGPRYQHGPY